MAEMRRETAALWRYEESGQASVIPRSGAEDEGASERLRSGEDAVPQSLEIPFVQENGEARFWVGVVSASHVQRGVRGGFAQMCHGKAAPLRRMRPGDGFVYYSPRTEMGSGDPLQAFTAIGRVADDLVYEYAMSETFVPFRRNIAYVRCKEARIADLLDRLNFTRGKRNWGYPFRMGHFEIDREDFATIAAAMQADFRMAKIH